MYFCKLFLLDVIEHRPPLAGGRCQGASGSRGGSHGHTPAITKKPAAGAGVAGGGAPPTGSGAEPRI